MTSSDAEARAQSGWLNHEMHAARTASPVATDMQDHQDESSSISSNDNETRTTDTTSISDLEIEPISTYGNRETSGRKQDGGTLSPISCPKSSLQLEHSSSTVQSEFAKIEAAYPKLQPTGCTKKFCQSARMIKTDEPRIGRDRSVQEVQSEAYDFLRQLRAENVIDSDDNFSRRREVVSDEIEKLSSTSKADVALRIGGTWTHSLEELQHGLRLAWKHSSKCIMRSEYQSLQYVSFICEQFVSH